MPLADAVANVSAATELVLGIQRSDLTLIGRGLADRLHQPHRAHLYPRSMEIVEEAPRMGAIGATISGAGPTVLVWTFWQSTGEVMKAIAKRVGDWAEVRRVPFSPDGRGRPGAVSPSSNGLLLLMKRVALPRALASGPPSHNTLSLWSEDSFLSIASKGSALSIGSVGSFASIGSIGSAASAFSDGGRLRLGGLGHVRTGS